jgi:hypothetical protein
MRATIKNRWNSMVELPNLNVLNVFNKEFPMGDAAMRWIISLGAILGVVVGSASGFRSTTNPPACCQEASSPGSGTRVTPPAPAPIAPPVAERANTELEKTIQHGLDFLVKDSLAWKNEHNCASCHHAALVVWSMREAKMRGHAVDETVLQELTTWLAESGDGKVSLPRPESAPKAFNAKAVWFALALGADPKPDSTAEKGLKLLLETVKGDQTESGAWAWWPETRPPIFGNSDETITAMATLALLPAATADDARAVRDKGVKWLAESKTDGDLQNVALRLVLWTRLERPKQEWESLVRRIQETQNADGGWSQAKDLASDAWGTGQALYALGHAGVKGDDPVVERARTFLIKTQREDGSWPMASRPIKPDGAGSTSLIPITGAGSAWAVMGLVRSR